MKRKPSIMFLSVMEVALVFFGGAFAVLQGDFRTAWMCAAGANICNSLKGFIK